MDHLHTRLGFEHLAPPKVTPSMNRLDLLHTAIDLTGGDRNETYGEPVANHEHIARIFNAMTGREFTSRDVALVHMATKLARLCRNSQHIDSHVDLMAYVGIAYECANAQR